MEIPCAVVARDAHGDPAITLRGDFDFRNSRVVLDAVQLASRIPGGVIAVDLGAVTFIDSSGISALVRAARTMRDQQRLVRLVRTNRHIIEILLTAGFTHYFLFDEEAEYHPSAPMRDGDGARMWQHASFNIPARLSLISHVRGRIAEMVESVPGADEHLDSIRLAVGEAASNAVRHGCACNDLLKVAVECSTDGETLIVEISDPGPGFDPDEVPTPLAGELREGGMGIHFMRLTMDEVSYRFNGRGTTVRLRKQLQPDGSLGTTSPGCQPFAA
jgi:serine/threonine-protein kinase RsbW